MRRKHIEKPNAVGFVKTEVVEKTTKYQATHIAVASMTLLINDVELSIPQGTPAAYLAELIEWLNENSSCFIDLSFNLRLTSTIE
ncbi:hypothetical protein L910_0607 [Vibrio fluvialis PG41]|uniref:Uncharacterized protein n=1 Tax=Vibrio fluvialis PG41 TaxID=1336752 RepID=S7IBE9_VIBFL|nr:hypothetical protein L910_0607 [Vibrio fluvialis PG41]